MTKYTQKLTDISSKIVAIIICIFSLTGLGHANVLESKTLYIWEFTTRDGKKSDLTANFTEEFEEALINTNYCTVLERRHYSRLFAQRENEKGIMQIEDIPDAKIKSLRSLQADLVIFGEIYDDINGGHVKTSIVIQNFRGTILSKESVLLPRGKRFDPKSRQEFMRELVSKIIPESGINSRTEENENFRFVLQECKASGDKVACSLMITNKGGDTDFSLMRSTRLFDNFGNEYYASSIRLGDKYVSDGRQVEKTLITNVSVKTLITFKSVNKEAVSIPVLEIRFKPPYNSGRGTSVKFRDVTLNK